jgi:hypothetical protein
MKFTDLKFKRHEDHIGWLCQTKIGDNVLSLFAGKMAYSRPRHDLYNPQDYTAFEVAIIEDSTSELITKEIFPDELDSVLSYQTPEEIDKIIKHLESL